MIRKSAICAGFLGFIFANIGCEDGEDLGLDQYVALEDEADLGPHVLA